MSKKLSQNNKTKFKPEFFFNREISWLEFNRRVLHEAQDARTPLLERFRFLAIYTSNLDEFVMKRVGGLKRRDLSDAFYLSNDGLTAQEQLDQIRKFILKDNNTQDKCFTELKNEAKKFNIHLYDWENLTDEQIDFCNKYFLEFFFPILTPLSVDPGKNFPFISNLSFSFAILLKYPDTNEKIFSRVKIPEPAHAWVELPCEDGHTCLINGASIIEKNLHHLYRGMEIEEIIPFRVTRNADITHDDEDTEDLLELIEETINERRFQEPIRLECPDGSNEILVNYILNELKLSGDDLYYFKNNFDYLSMHSIADLDIKSLRYPYWRPLNRNWYSHDIFESIRNEDRLVHHPYENFSSSVEKFIVDAASDPNVLSIKMTLYRTGDNSKFIEALIDAAENGKQVVCLIELKARFDEKRNIHWARKMEEAGVHVVYGIVGLKTHTKIALVVRRELSGDLLQYTHIGTGNYNAKTAKLYTDLGIFTVDKRISTEVNEVFNYLTGTSLKIDYKELLVAPLNAKSKFLAEINKQIKLAKNGKSARIVAKMNSMEDTAITSALYQASQEGVQIDLIVRGFCCIRPQVKNISENIRIISIIGRFLEHSRVFFFSDGSEDEWAGKYFIGSADWMYRNMHSRVEVITPVYSTSSQVKIAHFLNILLKDNRSAWELQANGSYIQRKGKSGTHDKMMKYFIKITDSEII